MANAEYGEDILRDKYKCFSAHDKFVVVADHIASINKELKISSYESRINALENEVGVLKNAMKELEQYIFELNKTLIMMPLVESTEASVPEKQ